MAGWLGLRLRTGWGATGSTSCGPRHGGCLHGSPLSMSNGSPVMGLVFLSPLLLQQRLLYRHAKLSILSLLLSHNYHREERVADCRFEKCIHHHPESGWRCGLSGRLALRYRTLAFIETRVPLCLPVRRVGQALRPHGFNTMYHWGAHTSEFCPDDIESIYRLPASTSSTLV